MNRWGGVFRGLASATAAACVMVSSAIAAAQVLNPGEALDRGEGIYSTNGRYYFVMQDDGNLVLYRVSPWAPLWATGTDGIAVQRAIMQDDGNLVLYDYAGGPRWASGTHGHPGSYLIVQDDGNVVIYQPKYPLWASGTNQTQESCATETVLSPGTRLARGASVYSANGKYQLVMQNDGNLVLYRVSPWAPLWATGTDGVAIEHAIMQEDGNLVLYDYAGRPRWASNTHGNPGAFLNVQCDGNVVIYKPNVPIWATDTVQ